jgi:hypothetical protein
MTEISAPTSPPVGFIDNPHAPDVFADAISGFFHFSGNLRMTLESIRVSHVTTPGPINRVVIGRLVMPIDAAEEFARRLLEFTTQQRTAANPPPQAATGSLH